jgi:hypothetical protein
MKNILSDKTEIEVIVRNSCLMLKCDYSSILKKIIIIFIVSVPAQINNEVGMVIKHT